MRGLRAGSWPAPRPPAGASGIAAFLRAGRRPLTTQLVVCAGDSLTRGRSSANWVEILPRRFAPGGYEFANAGIDGDLAWNVLARIGDVVRCEPDIVTLLVGSNDVIAPSSAFRLTALLPAAHNPPPYTARVGPMIRASLSHHVLRRSWDQISTANGLAALTGHVHLNNRAAALAAALVTDFITADPQKAP